MPALKRRPQDAAQTLVNPPNPTSSSAHRNISYIELRTAAANTVGISPFLLREDVAQLLGVTTKTIVRYEQLGLPVLRRRGLGFVLYRLADVLSFIEGESPQHQPPRSRRGRRKNIELGTSMGAE